MNFNFALLPQELQLQILENAAVDALAQDHMATPNIIEAFSPPNNSLFHGLALEAYERVRAKTFILDPTTEAEFNALQGDDLRRINYLKIISPVGYLAGHLITHPNYNRLKVIIFDYSKNPYSACYFSNALFTGSSPTLERVVLKQPTNLINLIGGQKLNAISRELKMYNYTQDIQSESTPGEHEPRRLSYYTWDRMDGGTLLRPTRKPQSK